MMRLHFLIALVSTFFYHPLGNASGMDVQLKDLRHSYFYIQGGAKDCTQLGGAEIKKFGRLTHCDPESEYVECKLKNGENLFLFEHEDACDTAAKIPMAVEPPSGD